MRTTTSSIHRQHPLLASSLRGIVALLALVISLGTPQVHICISEVCGIFAAPSSPADLETRVSEESACACCEDPVDDDAPDVPPMDPFFSNPACCLDLHFTALQGTAPPIVKPVQSLALLVTLGDAQHPYAARSMPAAQTLLRMGGPPGTEALPATIEILRI